MSNRTTNLCLIIKFYTDRFMYNPVILSGPHSVGLLWARDRPIAETCAWERTFTTDRYLCPWREWNPQTIIGRPTPQTARNLWKTGLPQLSIPFFRDTTLRDWVMVQTSKNSFSTFRPLKMNTPSGLEKSGTGYQLAERLFPNERNLQRRRCENLKIILFFITFSFKIGWSK